MEAILMSKGHYKERSKLKLPENGGFDSSDLRLTAWNCYWAQETNAIHCLPILPITLERAANVNDGPCTRGT